jgi:3-methyl-2-oxobutanoate hydroxymethyltransferase
LDIPTIGIGAGPGCDGQVLVTHDLLGIFERFTPRFVKRYADLAVEMREAFYEYITEVKANTFPGVEHTVEIDDDEWQSLEEKLNQ